MTQSHPVLTVEPLTDSAFAPFGDRLAAPEQAGRAWFGDALFSDRPAARPILGLSRIEQAGALPLTVRRMERHARSSQSFVPLDELAMLVVVAPDMGGRPDLARARAFVAANGLGVTYAANVWHHPLTLLTAPARLAVWMWRDGGPEDEEFQDVPPFTVAE